MEQPGWRCLAGLLLILALFLTPTVPVRADSKVVGNGTATSCTTTALVTAVAGGGEISFNCGAAPHTIVLPTPLIITSAQTIIDGGGLITLQGGGGRIIDHFTTGNSGSSRLELRNLTITGGRASGGGTDQSAFKGSGGAIRSYFAAANPDRKSVV